MGNQKTPQVPDPAKVYRQGLEINLKYAPQAKAAENKLRWQYDNLDVEQNLNRQSQFGGQFSNLYSDALAQASPFAQAVRTNLGKNISDNLAKGYALNDEQKREAEQAARSWQASTGNILGNAAASAEASTVWQVAQTARQQRIWGAENFLSAADPVKSLTGESMFMQAATAPDRSTDYLNGLSGPQNDLSAYQQQAEQFALNANPNDYLSPWQRMAQGAYIGLRQGWSGGSIVGPYFGAIGAAAGAAGGSFQGFINAPDYRWNVTNSGYAIYGKSPWTSGSLGG